MVKEQEDMTRMNIGVSVDKKLWLRLKAIAIVKDVQTGEVLDEAVREYIERSELQKQN